MHYATGITGTYKKDIILSRLEGLEGVNAIADKQVIECNPSLTVIYGANGSGKSGYTRLMKKVFYSKSPEDILGNIHDDTGPKAVKASFIFTTAAATIVRKYPEDADQSEFQQFAVFDGKSGVVRI